MRDEGQTLVLETSFAPSGDLLKQGLSFHDLVLFLQSNRM